VLTRTSLRALLLLLCLGPTAAASPAARSLASAATARPELYLSLGHTAEITDVAWSPDGRTIATGARDHSVILWDVATTRPRGTLRGHTSGIRQIAWRPDGKLLATLDAGEIGFLWEATSGRRLARLEGVQALNRALVWSPDGMTLAGGRVEEVVLWEGATGNRRLVLKDVYGLAIAWSPDSRTLATRKEFGRIAATLWDPATGRRRAELRGYVGYAGTIEWSPDGRYVSVAAEEGGGVAVWDVVTGRRRDLVQSREGNVPGSPFAWNPRGTLLATASASGRVVWNPATGERRATVRGHDRGVAFLAWSPDGATLASCGDFGGTIIWNAGDWTRRASMETRGFPRWSPTGKVLATTESRGTELWDARTGKRLASLLTTTDVAWSPDGKRLAEAGRALTSVPLRDPWTGAVRATLRGHAAPVQPGCLAWSPDGMALAVGYGHWMTRGASYQDIVADGSVVIWDGGTGQPRGAIGGLPDVVHQLAWRPDGTTLAAATERRSYGPHSHYRLYITGGDVVPWDAVRQRRLVPLAEASVGVSWSPDGKWLATGGEDWREGMILWDASSWRPHARLGRGMANPWLVWSPDGKRFASYGSDEMYTLWDVATLTRRATITPRARSGFLSWSPDGATIAVNEGTRTIRLHDPVSGSLRHTLVQRLPTRRDRESHLLRQDDVLQLAWRPDGRCVAAGSNGSGVIKVWYVQTGRLNQILGLPTRGLATLEWSPDGRTLAAAVKEKVIHLIDPAAPNKRSELKGHSGDITALQWSPQGQRLATGSEDGSVRLWSAATDRELAAFYALDHGTEWLAHTPDGYFTASPGAAHLIQWRQGDRLWPGAKFRRRFERPDLVGRALSARPSNSRR
jgi:WD40 repeat protein